MNRSSGPEPTRDSVFRDGVPSHRPPEEIQSPDVAPSIIPFSVDTTSGVSPNPLEIGFGDARNNASYSAFGGARNNASYSAFGGARNNASYSALSCSPLQYGTRMDFQSSAAVEGGPFRTWNTTRPAVDYPRRDRELPDTHRYSPPLHAATEGYEETANFNHTPQPHAVSYNYDEPVESIQARPRLNDYTASFNRGLEENRILMLAESKWRSLQSDKDRAGWLDILASNIESIDEFRPNEITPSWCGFIRFQWELPAVMKEMKKDGRVRRASSSSNEDEPPSDSLGRLVALTGSDGVYECAALEQFLTKNFGSKGLIALRMISHAVRMLTDAKHPIQQTMRTDFGIKLFESTKRHVTFSVGASFDHDKAMFIQACAWIMSAVRLNPDYRATANGGQGKIYSSETCLKTKIIGDGPIQLLGFTLKALCELPGENSRSDSQCWRQLFRSGIVASYTLDRKWGRGMKMPFEMMVHLAAVENYYPIDGGTILHGFHTALVPIQKDEGSGIQWHLETGCKSGQSQLSPHELQSMKQSWFQTRNLEILTQTPCYVGWFPLANVVLGSRDLVECNRMSWSSGLRDRVRTAHRRGFEAGTQISFSAGPISIAPNIVNSWTFHSNVQRFNPSQQYIQAVRLNRSKVALVVDSCTKQAWLVPLLSLILHLCHRYFQGVKLGHEVNQIPFAKPSPDGAGAVIDAIEQKGDLIVMGHGIADSVEPNSSSGETLRQLFLRISTNLSETSTIREQPKGKHIFASELMDLIHEPGEGSRLKEIEISGAMGSWRGLVEKVDVIGCCASIGRLIEPVIPLHQKCQCHVLPESQFLLGAHMRCLDELARRAGSSLDELKGGGVCKFGDKAFWCLEKWCSWASCGDRMHPSIWTETLEPNRRFFHQITQKKVKQEREEGQTYLTYSTEDGVDKDGVVVFGGYPSRKTALQKAFTDLNVDRLRRPIVFRRQISGLDTLDTVQLSEQSFPNMSNNEPA